MANIIKRKEKSGLTYKVQVRYSGYGKTTETFDTEQAAEDWPYELERDIRDRKVDPRGLS